MLDAELCIDTFFFHRGYAVTSLCIFLWYYCRVSFCGISDGGEVESEKGKPGQTNAWKFFGFLQEVQHVKSSVMQKHPLS